LDDRYDTTTVRLHWTVAALVVVLWGLGQIIGSFPTHVNDALRSTHVVLGAALAVAMVVRVTWRAWGAPAIPAAETGLFGRVAHGTHLLLYALAAAVLALGFALIWADGDDIFGLFTIPTFQTSALLGPNTRELHRSIRGWHGLLANWLMIVAGLHAAAALFHHYVLRDSILRRMLPRV
jgi:cytochrome b561